MEGPYYVMTSGSNCGSGMIMESSECAAAATALGLSDTTVTMSSSQYSYAPQGCTYSPATSYSSGSLYLYQYDDGSCSSTKQCICKIPPSPSPPPQQHWVRGNLMRVSEAATSPGGLEWDKVGSATPRVSGDGNKVVFYSDATFSSAGFEKDGAYHIWM